jgi:Tol biopolymer transport system component/DNA-binding winged helix-turn-helix (wHTH) protein
MTDQHEELYEFGAFTLNPREPVIYEAGKPLTLQPMVFELLKLLLENSGQILEKDQLMARLWPDCSVEESSLTQLVFQLRKALGESGARQHYIETIPRRGYRFIAEVRLTHRSDHEIVLTSRTGSHMVIKEEETTLPAVVEQSAVHNDVQTAAQPRTLTRRAWQTLAAVLVVALTGVGVWQYTQRQRATAVFTNFSQRKLTTTGKVFRPAVSPDGKWVAYVCEEDGKQGLWVRQIETANRVQVVPFGDQTIHGVTLSPDGQFIYYSTSQPGARTATLHQVSIIGGAPHTVLDDVDSPITFAPDGKRFAFVRDAAAGKTLLMTARSDGGDLQTVAARQRPERFATAGPAWSPDGQTIVCAAATAAPQPYMYLTAINVADGQLKPVNTERWTTVGQAAWLPDGSGIVFSAWHQAAPVFAEQLWLAAWPDGAARQITKDLLSREGVSLAARASALVTGYADRVARIWLMPDGKTSEARPIKASLSDNYSETFGMDWTPSGKLVLSSHANGNADIYLMNADGTGQRQLTYEARREYWPVVAADGRYIVFASSGAESAHLWRLDLESNTVTQLTHGKGETFPSLSPDGRWVVYSSAEAGESNLWKIPMDGGTPERLTQKPSGRAAVSPDGQFIACLYRTEPQKPIQVALIPFAGGVPVKVFERMPLPDWSTIKWTPDGKALAYIATHHGVSNLWAQPLDGSAPRQLTEFNEDRIYRFAWSRDGQRLALDRGMTIRDILLLNDFQ